MNRADRRQREKEMKSLAKTVINLSPQQTKVIEAAANEKAQLIANKYMSEMKQIIEDCTCCVLYDAELNALELMDKLNRLMIQESLYIEEEGIEVDKKVTREMIVESAKKHGLDKAGRGKIAKELKSTYSTITTYISRWKITDADLGKVEVKVQTTEVNEEDPELQEIYDYVFGDEEEKGMDNKEVKKVLTESDKVAKEAEKETVKPVVVTKATVTEANLNSEKKSLRIKSMVLEGENGTYRACANGIELTDMGSIISFENVGQVDEFAAEIKQVFGMLKR